MDEKEYGKLYDKWWNQALADLSGFNIREKVASETGLMFAVDHNFKCPECGKKQVARYHVPAGLTVYYECGHKHGGIPRNFIE